MRRLSAGSGSRHLAWRLLPACLITLVVASARVVAAEDPVALIARALSGACAADPAALSNAFPDAAATARERVDVRGNDIGWRQNVHLAGGGQIMVENLRPAGALPRVSVEYSAPVGTRARPVLLAIADGGCHVRAGRRLLWGTDPNAPEALQILDRHLQPVGAPEPLNPPVPPGTDPGGVPVAMVDSGVNYLLPSIASRLARAPDGTILGYDWWDMDRRPFDSDPAGSPFLVQHHGTRTASLLLAEAPVASLVPLRYPHPDMMRMRRLIQRAAANGVVIFNLSLESRRADEWEGFREAAAAHPELLFVVSAGSQGRDIDAEPEYPASLLLPNVLAVTSSEDDGVLAAGSNWGRRDVQLMVPAERQVVTGFSGHARLVSGSDYAAVRVSALAACLLAANPSWRAPELRRAILAMAQPLPGSVSRVAVGLLPDPVARRRGLCPAQPTSVSQLSDTRLSDADVYPHGVPAGARYLMSPALVLLHGSGWRRAQVRKAFSRSAAVLAQCAVRVRGAHLYVLQTPRHLLYYLRSWASELARDGPATRPAVFFLRDTVEEVAYGAEAVGRANSGGRPSLVDTVWMMHGVADPGISLAHELVHVLMDSGEHVHDRGNLMAEPTTGDNTRLSAAQCRRLTRTGLSNGLLRPND